MNNATFVMGIVLTMLILFLSLSAQAVEAADMADVTLQVLESNDPSGIVNNIELPDIVTVEHDSSNDKHDSSHDAKHDIEDNVHDAHDGIEDDISDTRDDITDSLDQAEVEGDDPQSDGN
jgi:hypothetical protein